DADGIAARIGELRVLEKENRQLAGPVVRDVAEAMVAYARGDWPGAISLLQPALTELVRVGGSRAQRDVVEHTLLSAYLGAGRDDEAARMLRRRLAGRPSCPPSSS